MSASETNILVFDSGVGGLSIVSHIHQLLPAVTITYLADNELFPYGLLQDGPLIERVSLIIQQAIAVKKPDIIVIACNSASTLVLPTLRKTLGIPLVGVVPAIKPAAKLSQSKIIGLLATPGTIKRDYTDELIGNFASDCEIIRVGSTELVQMVEHKIAGIRPSTKQLKKIMRQFEDHPHGQKMDTVVLACTHFPLIKEELAEITPQIKYWVDSGEAIARRVRSLIVDKTSNSDHPHCWLALFSDLSMLNAAQTQYLTKLGFTELGQL